MNNRALALDALRGYAIITMVLSATIVTHVLPGWMSHAQTPPPDHVFNPLLPGVTWVDLVFPFFLFAMGAAFPFSIRKRAEKGDSKLKLVYEAVKRGIQLTFFAIFIQHFYPYMLSSPQDMRAWLLAILCFAVLFPMFMRIPLKMPDWAQPGREVKEIGPLPEGATLTPPEQTLEEAKADKHREAGASFAQKRDAIRQVQLSDGNTYGFDCANEDITNFMASWKAAEVSGSAPYKVWKADGSKGMITMQLADFKTVFNAVRTSQLEAYAWYGAVDVQIQAAATKEDLETIVLE